MLLAALCPSWAGHRQGPQRRPGRAIMGTQEHSSLGKTLAKTAPIQALCKVGPAVTQLMPPPQIPSFSDWSAQKEEFLGTAQQSPRDSWLSGPQDTWDPSWEHSYHLPSPNLGHREQLRPWAWEEAQHQSLAPAYRG